jgi:hypothetical protein
VGRLCLLMSLFQQTVTFVPFCGLLQPSCSRLLPPHFPPPSATGTPLLLQLRGGRFNYPSPSAPEHKLMQSQLQRSSPAHIKTINALMMHTAMFAEQSCCCNYSFGGGGRGGLCFLLCCCCDVQPVGKIILRWGEMIYTGDPSYLTK